MRNLYNAKAGDVRTFIGDHFMALLPGEETMVAPDTTDLNAAIDSDGVMGRRIKTFAVPDVGAATHCEISLSTLVQNSVVLRDTVGSATTADRAFCDKLQKSTARLTLSHR